MTHLGVEHIPDGLPPVGSFVALTFRVVGYDSGGLAQLEAVEPDGAGTGWTPDCLGLGSEGGWVRVDGPGALVRLTEESGRWEANRRRGADG